MKIPIVTADELLKEDDMPGDRSGILIDKFVAMHEARVGSIRDLTGHPPAPGEIYWLWTINSFNAFTFIPYILNEAGPIDQLILSTYSINIRIIDALIRRIRSNDVRSVDIFISDSIRSRLPRVYDNLISLKEEFPVRIQYAWNHSKITLMRCADQHFVVAGSGNWGENAQFEQYVFTNSQTVFDFYKNAITNAADRSAL